MQREQSRIKTKKDYAAGATVAAAGSTLDLTISTRRVGYRVFTALKRSFEISPETMPLTRAFMSHACACAATLARIAFLKACSWAMFARANV